MARKERVYGTADMPAGAGTQTCGPNRPPEVTPEDMERARQWLRNGPLEHADYTGDPLEVEANLAAEFAAVRRGVLDKANEAWPEGYDEPARNATSLKFRIKDLLKELDERTAEVERALEELRNAVAEETYHTKDYKSGALHALDAALRRLREKRALDAAFRRLREKRNGERRTDETLHPNAATAVVEKRQSDRRNRDER